MKITITREIDVPKELICNYGRSGKCNALRENICSRRDNECGTTDC